MTLQYVASLRRAPLKGAQMLGQNALHIDPEVGVVGDRRFGVKRKPNVPNEWGPKGKFFVAINTPLMPAEMPVFEGLITVADQVYPPRQSYLESLAKRLGAEGPLAVLDTKGEYNLTDDKEPYVSFLNLASVRALEDFLGHPVVPERFRMNVWLDGIPPFYELTWVHQYPGTYEFQVGEVRFRVEDVCERCKATEANPHTGTYDLPILAALEEMMREAGYKGSPKRGKLEVMGVLARPLNPGIINVGDPLTV